MIDFPDCRYSHRQCRSAAACVEMRRCLAPPDEPLRYDAEGLARLHAAMAATPIPIELLPSNILEIANTCLLSDLHHSLHRGEKCPECGFCFEEDE